MAHGAAHRVAVFSLLPVTLLETWNSDVVDGVALGAACCDMQPTLGVECTFSGSPGSLGLWAQNPSTGGAAYGCLAASAATSTGSVDEMHPLHNSFIDFWFLDFWSQGWHLSSIHFAHSMGRLTASLTYSQRLTAGESRWLGVLWWPESPCSMAYAINCTLGLW